MDGLFFNRHGKAGVHDRKSELSAWRGSVHPPLSLAKTQAEFEINNGDYFAGDFARTNWGFFTAGLWISCCIVGRRPA